MEERRAELIVVDASVLIAAFLPDEVEAKAIELLEDLQYGRAVYHIQPRKRHAFFTFEFLE